MITVTTYFYRYGRCEGYNYYGHENPPRLLRDSRDFSNIAAANTFAEKQKARRGFHSFFLTKKKTSVSRFVNPQFLFVKPEFDPQNAMTFNEPAPSLFDYNKNETNVLLDVKDALCDIEAALQNDVFAATDNGSAELYSYAGQALDDIECALSLLSLLNGGGSGIMMRSAAHRDHPRVYFVGTTNTPLTPQNRATGISCVVVNEQGRQPCRRMSYDPFALVGAYKTSIRNGLIRFEFNPPIGEPYVKNKKKYDIQKADIYTEENIYRLKEIQEALYEAACVVYRCVSDSIHMDFDGAVSETLAGKLLPLISFAAVDIGKATGFAPARPIADDPETTAVRMSILRGLYAQLEKDKKK